MTPLRCRRDAVALFPASLLGQVCTNQATTCSGRGCHPGWRTVDFEREPHEPRRRFAAMMSGLDIHYDLGEGHRLLGRRMPDIDLVTDNGSLRVFTLLHGARPLLLNFGEPGCFDITPWVDRVRSIDATYDGVWELPALGAVTAPTAVLIRPDGYVVWVGDRHAAALAEALTMWFGPAAAA